jgi:DNA-nicking Smr family endonuclease
MTGSAKGARQPTAEERALWRTAMRDVAPFQPQPPLPVPPPVPNPLPAAPPAAPPLMPAGRAARLPPLEPGRSVGVDHRTDQRLRRGRLEIEARLDLHGLTQERAHRELTAFLHAGSHAGRRCVLVVTGKGGGRGNDGRGTGGEGGGVLRRMVPRWLAEPELRPLVVAVHPAQPRDGGEGALYLLLRRRRG